MKLWNKYKQHLAEDILHKMNQQKNTTDYDINVVYDKCLQQIEAKLKQKNKTLKDYNIFYNNPLYAEKHISIIYEEETNFNKPALKQIVNDRIKTLNNEQRNMFTRIMQSINSSNPHSFFISAAGGTGIFIFN